MQHVNAPDIVQTMSTLMKAAALLDDFYAGRPAPDEGDLWTICVRLIVSHGRSAKQADWTWIAETPLQNVSETAQTTPAVLATVLESHLQPVKGAAALVALAKWWRRARREDGDLSEGNPFENTSIETLREKLRAMPGISLELADKLLLAGGRLAIPLDRGTQRVVCRHGWLDWQSEYEEWQSLFRREWPDPATLAEVSWLFGRVAKDFCRPKAPLCEGCPLQRLLPLHGPIEFDD